jgi:hypothetical protein
MKKLLLVASLLSVSGAFGMQPFGTPPAARTQAYIDNLTMPELIQLKDRAEAKIDEIYCLHSKARQDLKKEIRLNYCIGAGAGLVLTGVGCAIASTLFYIPTRQKLGISAAVGILASHFYAERAMDSSLEIRNAWDRVLRYEADIEQARGVYFAAEKVQIDKDLQNRSYMNPAGQI